MFKAAIILTGMITAGAVSAAEPVHVAIYRGPAGCEGCSEAVQRAFERIGADYLIEYVGPDELLDVEDVNTQSFDIYVQPGGGQDIPAALDSIGDDGAAAIKDFVADGGKYLGLCMGAYLASASNLGLIADDLDSEVGREGFPVTTIADASVSVTWNGDDDQVFFQDGPYLLDHEGELGFHTIATYENGDIAAARYAFGDGTVVLSGPHPEAESEWFIAADLPLDSMPRGDLFDALVDQLVH